MAYNSNFFIRTMPLAFILGTILLASVKGNDVICPRNGATDTGANLKIDDPNGPKFREVSGIGLSPFQRNPDTGALLLYAISDGGGGTRLGVFDSSTGDRLLTLRLNDSVPGNIDWEGMAIGSCGIDWTTDTCIYIADFGDNHAMETRGTKSGRGSKPYRIIKVREPKIAEFADNDAIPLENVHNLEYNYRHETSPTKFSNAESLFLDHTGWGEGNAVGDLYIVTKWGGQRENFNRLFHIPASAWENTTAVYSPAAVGSSNSSDSIMQETWTSADMIMNGTLVALRTQSSKRVYLFPRCPGESVENALVNGATACYIWSNTFHYSHAVQIESILWTPDGTRTLQIAESNNPPLMYTTMDYGTPAQTISCALRSPPIITPTGPTPGPTTGPTPGPTPGSPIVSSSSGLRPLPIPGGTSESIPRSTSSGSSTQYHRLLLPTCLAVIWILASKVL